ncbi:MAG TPA: lipopolysaccharide heptosyltransferase II [Nitrospirales bacterium]|nr:lipopolysaccharide heptosyltransferase II [Nitrospirales bacterium]
MSGPRILIIKPSSLGDIVHAMPAVAALRRALPAAEITWLVKRQWAPIVERAEGVDRIWPVDGGWLRWLRSGSALRGARFDVAVDLQGLFRSGLMAWLSGAPRRIGFAAGREGSPWFYRERVTVPTTEMHAVDRYLLVAAALGADVSKPVWHLRETDDDRERVAATLREAGLAAGRWIAVAPSGRWPTKRWPLQRFAEVADALHHAGVARVALIGAPDDLPLLKEMEACMRTTPAILAGAVDVGRLPALLRSAAVLLTNDSGPMHVAAAVGTPVVAVFGPTSAVRTGPYGDGHVVLSADVSCRPCFSRTCGNRVDPLACLTGISVDAVLEQVRRQLASRVSHAVLHV